MAGDNGPWPYGEGEKDWGGYAAEYGGLGVGRGGMTDPTSHSFWRCDVDVYDLVSSGKSDGA